MAEKATDVPTDPYAVNPPDEAINDNGTPPPFPPPVRAFRISAPLLGDAVIQHRRCANCVMISEYVRLNSCLHVMSTLTPSSAIISILSAAPADPLAPDVSMAIRFLNLLRVLPRLVRFSSPYGAVSTDMQLSAFYLRGRCCL